MLARIGAPVNEFVGLGRARTRRWVAFVESCEQILECLCKRPYQQLVVACPSAQRTLIRCPFRDYDPRSIIRCPGRLDIAEFALLPSNYVLLRRYLVIQPCICPVGRQQWRKAEDSSIASQFGIRDACSLMRFASRGRGCEEWGVVLRH